MQVDAFIVGAGVVGSAIAYELARSGRTVMVADTFGAVGHGSTSASSGVVRFNFATWSGVASAWEAKFGWENWADHLGVLDSAGSARFVRTGLVMLDVPDAPRERYLALFDRARLPYEEWSDQELKRNLPWMDVGKYWPPKPVDDPRFGESVEGCVGALFTPDAGYVSDPQRATYDLAAAAIRHGAVFALRRSVRSIEPTSAAALRVGLDDNSVVHASAVVNAGGPWSRQVNDIAGVGGDASVKTRALRQEVVYLSAPAAYSAGLHRGIAVADLDLGIYLRGDERGGLIIGGTEPACDEMCWLETPNEADAVPRQDALRVHALRAAHRVPDLVVPNRLRGIVGVYDVTDDWAPIYDKTELPGYYVAIGTSGNQFKNAPVIGGFIRAIIEHSEAGLDHDLTPANYRCRYTGAEIDLAAYSRKRAIGEGAPRTVMG